MRRLSCVVLLVWMGLVIVPSAAFMAGDLRINGLSLGPDYVYRDGEYLTRAMEIDRLAIAQVDFWPPETSPPCVWVRSSLQSLDRPGHGTNVTIDYCGGIGWRHWIVEPVGYGWHRWIVEIGLPGSAEAQDGVLLYVRRGED